MTKNFVDVNRIRSGPPRSSRAKKPKSDYLEAPLYSAAFPTEEPKAPLAAPKERNIAHSSKMREALLDSEEAKSPNTEDNFGNKESSGNTPNTSASSRMTFISGAFANHGLKGNAEALSQNDSRYEYQRDTLTHQTLKPGRRKHFVENGSLSSMYSAAFAEIIPKSDDYDALSSYPNKSLVSDDSKESYSKRLEALYKNATHKASVGATEIGPGFDFEAAQKKRTSSLSKGQQRPHSDDLAARSTISKEDPNTDKFIGQNSTPYSPILSDINNNQSLPKSAEAPVLYSSLPKDDIESPDTLMSPHYEKDNEKIAFHDMLSQMESALDELYDDDDEESLESSSSTNSTTIPANLSRPYDVNYNDNAYNDDDDYGDDADTDYYEERLYGANFNLKSPKSNSIDERVKLYSAHFDDEKDQKLYAPSSDDHRNYYNVARQGDKRTTETQTTNKNNSEYVIALQERIAWLEHNLEESNQEIKDLNDRVAYLEKAIKILTSMQNREETVRPQSEETPPPHY